MGCRIIEGQEGGTGDPVEVFFCSSEGWAFGPVMGEGEAQTFQDWLAREKNCTDPRDLDPVELHDAWKGFRARPMAQHSEVA